MLKKKIICMTALILAPATAWAFPGHFQGNVQGGYLASTGNSRSQSLNAKAGVTYSLGKWTHSLKGSATSASQQGSSTAERYTAQGKSEYNFTQNNYAYGQVSFLKNLFGGIRQRTTETAGYGRRLLKTANQTLDAEIGAGLRQSQEQKPSLLWHHNIIGQASADYTYRISSSSQFEQTLNVESGSNNTLIESETSLKLAIVSHLFAKLSYTVDHNTSVADNLAQTDTYTSVSLSYEFGQSGTS